jgi:hypothetical protein
MDHMAYVESNSNKKKLICMVVLPIFLYKTAVVIKVSAKDDFGSTWPEMFATRETRKRRKFKLVRSHIACQSAIFNFFNISSGRIANFRSYKDARFPS